MKLNNALVYLQGHLVERSVSVSNDGIVDVSASPAAGVSGYSYLVVPGLVDVHVHLREPGFFYKETIATGTRAAARGGYTAVCAMPNLKPVPDSVEHLEEERSAIRKDAKVHVYPYGAITVGQKGETMADLAGMAPYVCGFSDDGRGVQSQEMMKAAMAKAKELDKLIVAHCEDESLITPGWAIHDGEFCRSLGLIGNAPESEWKQVERDIALVREVGCKYHVCHISTKESVELVRKAKAEGLAVTCETGPHYLVLTDMELENDGRYKMNPPIRTAADRDALIAGLLDGTIDCIATDHAPHSAEEKGKGLAGSLNGIVGLETAFPILYTCLVETGIVPLEVILKALCVKPREIFGLPGGKIAEGEAADIAVLDTHRLWTIDPNNFRSLGRATPFAGWGVTAAVAMTIVGGEIVYADLKREEET